MTVFTVASLASFRGGRGAAKLGLRPLDVAQWLDRSPGWERRAAAKAAMFAAFPGSLIDAGGHDAAAELAALVGAAGTTLGDAALATFEDLCILERRGNADVFVAGAVAFPTD